MLDHVAQGGETSIVIEAAFLVRPESLERRGAITFVRRALGLKIVDADLFRRVHVPPRLSEGWRHVTHRTLRLTIEQRCTACRRRRIETSCRCCRGRDGELIEVKRRRLWG